MKPSISATFFARQNATSASASAAVGVSGFSHRTCLPRSVALRVHSSCSVFGSGMYTASMAESSSSASYVPCATGMLAARAATAARSRERLAMAHSSARRALAKAGTSRSLILATPRMPQHSLSVVMVIVRAARGGGSSAHCTMPTDVRLEKERLMCLLAVFFRVAEDAPVVVGANREEYFARGGEPPRLHAGPPPFVARTHPLGAGTR